MTNTGNKKLLIITDALRDQVNGVVTAFENIKEQAEANNYIVEFLDPSNFFHFSFIGYKEVKISLAFGIGKKIKKVNPDFIHIATEGPIGLASRLYLARHKIKFNTSYHTKFPETLNKMFGLPKKLTYRYVRWFHNGSQNVLAATKGMVNDLVTNGFNNVKLWTLGVNRKQLVTNKQRSKHDKVKLLYVGRVSKEKSLDDLKIFQDKYELVIVGDGPYRKDLEKILNKAKFEGYKKVFELADYYNDADVFVFPSRTDTFGLVMVEAMSLGTPVAAYPVRGPLEVIEPGVTGIMNDDLELAVKEALKLDRNKVKQASLKWSWENCWKIFEENMIEIKKN